jgi:hypothetical protein
MNVGATRWSEDTDFERNGGVFANEACARDAIERNAKVYAGCDDHIKSIRVVSAISLQSPSVHPTPEL